MHNRVIPAVAILGGGAVLALWLFGRNKEAEAASGKPSGNALSKIMPDSKSTSLGGTSNKLGNVASVIPGIGGTLGGIIGLIGIGKPKFRSSVNWAGQDWFDFHSAVSHLKNENGDFAFSPEPFKDFIGGAWRYVKGDYPIPDRDPSDIKNRELMAASFAEIQRVARLPINN